MLGAMTSRLRFHYTGIDPNTRTFQGLTALGELLNEQNLGAGYSMNCVPSEEFDPETGSYDAAFSSPPYFNLETYTDETTQCMNRYTDLSAWFDGYVAPTLEMVHQGLASDGIYAVNIADYKNGKEQFAIVDQWKSLSEKIGFEYCEQINMMLNVRPGVGNNRDTKIHKSEGVYIFRKRH
jgi:DNA modification methylase